MPMSLDRQRVDVAILKLKWKKQSRKTNRTEKKTSFNYWFQGEMNLGLTAYENFVQILKHIETDVN